MDTPIIGLTPLWDSKLNSVWMLPGYSDCIIKAGGVPIILPFTDNLKVLKKAVKKCDGFLFTGGQDISPKIYGEEISEKCGEISAVRDVIEDYIFKSEVIFNDKPLLGICLGFQIINAFSGGKLYQDLSQYNISGEVKNINHSQNSQHKVEIIKDTFLYDIFGESELKIISNHHQGVKKCGENLVISAFSADGLPEAVYMKNRKFVVAVQWHPELQPTETHSEKLFKALINSI
jgi:putative glutamine amidotransferase